MSRQDQRMEIMIEPLKPSLLFVRTLTCYESALEHRSSPSLGSCILTLASFEYWMMSRVKLLSGYCVKYRTFWASEVDKAVIA